MRKALLLAPLAIVIALAGFWFGKHQARAGARTTAAAGDAQVEPAAGSPLPPPADSPAATRDYADEAAIAEQSGTAGTGLVMPTEEDATRLPPPPPRPASPTENRLLGERGLRARDLRDLMNDARFGQVVDSLSREATPDSLEMTRIYRELVDSLLKPDSRFRVDRLSCGAHVCMGTATGPVGQDEEFGKLFAVDLKGAKYYAIQTASTPQKGNNPATEYRIVFTIDPRFNAFEGI